MNATEEIAYKAAVQAAVQDDSRSNAILIVTAVFLGISLGSVLLRCFVRTRVVRAFGWDDIIMLLAMVGRPRLKRYAYCSAQCLRNYALRLK
jgi:hypothetical protein